MSTFIKHIKDGFHQIVTPKSPSPVTAPRIPTIPPLPAVIPPPPKVLASDIVDLQNKFDLLLSLNRQIRVSELATAVSIDFRHPKNEPLNLARFLPTLPAPLAIYGLERKRLSPTSISRLFAHTEAIILDLINAPVQTNPAYEAFTTIPFGIREFPANFDITIFPELLNNDPYSVLCLALNNKQSMYQACKHSPPHYLQLILDSSSCLDQNETASDEPFKTLRGDPRIATRWLQSKAKDPSRPLEDPVILTHFRNLLEHMATQPNCTANYCLWHLGGKKDNAIKSKLMSSTIDPVIALQVAYELKPEIFPAPCIDSSPKWLYNRLFLLKEQPTSDQEQTLCSNAPWGIQYIEDCTPPNASALLAQIETRNTNPYWNQLLAAYKASKHVEPFDPFDL
jgi:hypothetical protein